MGIGEAVATSLAGLGASLILFARSEVCHPAIWSRRRLKEGIFIVQDKLAAITARLTSANPGGKSTYRAVDISDYDAVDGAVASSIEENGQIDILINNVKTRAHYERYES